MTTYLPTHQALHDVACLLELEPNDPAVVVAFDDLVLRGHLKPFVPDWWRAEPGGGQAMQPQALIGR